MTNWDFNTWVSVIFGIVFLYLILRLLFTPVKLAAKVIYRGLIGAALLLIYNYTLGLILGMQFTLNIVTALVAGVLGIPGLLIIMAVELFLS